MLLQDGEAIRTVLHYRMLNCTCPARRKRITPFRRFQLEQTSADHADRETLEPIIPVFSESDN